MDAVDRALAPSWAAMQEAVGPLALYDVHTHIGSSDPDGYRQSAAELLESLVDADARAVVFPMHEPGGYPPANDAVLAAAAAAPERLVAFCRVDPRADAVAEARRCLDAGARGIKLHPRAEGFALAEPAVVELARLAHERRVPILIHAGRGIPALGEHAVQLAAGYPDARFILAHAAVSDLAWLPRELPAHPNLLIDTSWWNPGDMIALFTLVPSGQILWASDSPYARPLSAATLHLRFATQAGIGKPALRSIAGGQIERILAGSELEYPGPPSTAKIAPREGESRSSRGRTAKPISKLPSPAPPGTSGSDWSRRPPRLGALHWSAQASGTSLRPAGPATGTAGVAFYASRPGSARAPIASPISSSAACSFSLTS